MKLLDFIFGKNQRTHQNSEKSYNNSHDSNEFSDLNTDQKQEIIFSKTDLEKIIRILSKLSELFRDSVSLKQTGNNRNITMMRRLHSYTGMYCYLYEKYEYGSVKDIVNSEILTHYALIALAMDNVSNRNNSIRDLADNWSDVLNTIQITELLHLSDGQALENMSNEIGFVTKAMEKWSGKKCKIQHNIIYNPYSITENKSMSEGHTIPDLSEVFAKELVTQLILGKSTGTSEADVVRNYVISLVKSYKDNAGFVPMNIIDQICDQIQIISDRLGIIYPSNKTLKQYLLEKIYIVS